MTCTPVKLLHLPNEPYSGFLQVGPRRALESLVAAGRISELRVLSFLMEAQRLGTNAACRSIIEEVERFQPDILLWHHVSNFRVDREFVAQLRRISPETLLVYHEGDAYGLVHKRYLPPMRVLMSSFDLVFQVALGPMHRRSEAIGATEVYWTPHSFASEVFPRLPVPSEHSREFEAVMIGNVVRRIPGIWGLPGSGERYRLGQKLSKMLGRKFAVYGHGWKNESAKGILPFERQQQVIRQSWVSVGWDHFPSHSYYFSDRLPIALAAGVPHVTGYHAGYENVFRGCPGIILAKTVQEAVDGTLYFLSLSRQKLVDLGIACRDFAFENFEAKHVYTTIFDRCLEKLAARKGMRDLVLR